MRKVILLGLAALLVLSVAPAGALADQHMAAEKPKIFNVGDVIDMPIMLEDFKSGEKVNVLEGVKSNTILSFMNSACGSCVGELQAIMEWVNENPGEAKLLIVSVDFNPNKERLERYALTNKVRGKWYLDPQFSTPALFDINSTPGMVVIDKDKKILYKKLGYNTGMKGHFKAKLSEVILK